MGANDGIAQEARLHIHDMDDLRGNAHLGETVVEDLRDAAVDAVDAPGRNAPYHCQQGHQCAVAQQELGANLHVFERLHGISFFGVFFCLGLERT
ncbi:hypothetical protein D3C79_995300 [compost metagenome]